MGGGNHPFQVSNIPWSTTNETSMKMLPLVLPHSLLKKSAFTGIIKNVIKFYNIRCTGEAGKSEISKWHDITETLYN